MYSMSMCLADIRSKVAYYRLLPINLRLSVHFYYILDQKYHTLHVSVYLINVHHISVNLNNMYRIILTKCIPYLAYLIDKIYMYRICGIFHRYISYFGVLLTNIQG